MSLHEFIHPNDLRVDQRVADQVLNLMLTAIRGGELGPRDVIHDHEWADALGVSRTPVREAIQRLLGMGLLEIAAARYTRLQSFTPTEAHREARDWALLHTAVVNSVIHHQPDGLLDTLHETHAQFTSVSNPAHAVRISFDFFHHLRQSISTSAISLGANASAYRLRLAEPMLPHPPIANGDLHHGIITAITRQDTDHVHSRFTDWANRELYTTAA